MKKAKFQFWKKQNAIIASFLTLLGFASSCKNDNQVKYGIPSADYIVKGKVESALNNTPINNIRIILNQDSLVTDVNGNYQFPTIIDIAGNKTYTIQFKDIDSNINGAFKTLDTTVVFTNPVYTNGDGEWYEGKTEKEFNVKLKPE